MNDAPHDRDASSVAGTERSLTDVALQGYRTIFESYVDANQIALSYGQSLFEIMTRPYAATLEAMTRTSDEPPAATTAPNVVEELESSDDPAPVQAAAAAIASPGETDARAASELDQVVEEPVKTFTADAAIRANAASKSRKRPKKRTR